MTAPATQDVESALARHRVVPVVVLEDASSARPLADALCAGGLPCAEVTLRTPAAEEGLRLLAGDPRMLVGAGTVLRPDQVDRALAAGARFVVSPGFSRAVVRRCREHGLPVFPGVATPSELQAALEQDLRVVKLFPAEALGGVATVRALAAPFPGVRLLPTGGISPATAGAYLAEPSVLAIGGSWMVAPRLLSGGAWRDVTRLAAEAVALAAEAPRPAGHAEGPA